MTELQRLQALELGLDEYSILVPRIIDVTGVPGAWYDIDEDTEKSDHDRFIVHESLVKPNLARIEEEFEEYKQELIDAENARLAEIARIQDIKDRFNSISDIRLTIDKAGLSITNPAIELKRIIEENDQSRLEVLEAASSLASAEITKQSAKETMDANIRAKAASITKASSSESAQAFFQAFQIRASNPASYVNEGLIVRYAITGFNIDEALNTEQKITDYYNGLLIEMDKYREQEIVNYISILNS